jgi:lipopolysaccharide export system protein LptA
MYITLCIGIALALISSAYCQTPVTSQESPSYELTADEIDCSQVTRKCVATSNARVTSGTGDNAKVLTARTVTASMQAEGVAPDLTAQVIDAEGDVFLGAQGGKIQSIRSDKARYEPDSQKATFEGNVQVHFGPHIFKGDHATAELTQGNFSLKRNDQVPVSGLIYPGVLSENRQRT